MKINRRKALKLVGMQIALATSLVVVQMGMQFATSYRWVGFEKKGGDGWYSVASQAQADNNLCQRDLEAASVKIRDFQLMRDGENSDLNN